MTRLWRLLAAYVNSMAGRIFLLLTVGMALAAILSLYVAEQAHQRDLDRIRVERVVASAVDVIGRLELNPVSTEKALSTNAIFGAHLAPNDIAIGASDRRLVALLTKRLGDRANPDAAQVATSFCGRSFPKAVDRAAGVVSVPMPDCWIVRFTDERGVQHSLAIDLPPLVLSRSSTLDPISQLLIVSASALLAWIAARFASGPTRRLQQAAAAFSTSFDPEPIPERGPADVRAALIAVNLMQQRMRDGMKERTHILAAVTHDLQTPLTRLRLRLEQVGDEDLRARLVADVSATQRMVHDGLDLARSSEAVEEWAMVDIDSLIAAYAEDAAEFGADVRFVRGCGASLRIKPEALARVLANLVDNAVQYGGNAVIDCHAVSDATVISVCDDGPGIPAGQEERLFEPFLRGENSRSRRTGGTGIGLTIARAQAETFGAHVTLGNRDSKGAIARIIIPNVKAGDDGQRR